MWQLKNKYLYEYKKTLLGNNMSLIQKRFLLTKTVNLKLCINCVNFIEDKTNYPYEQLPNDSLYGKCKLFGKQDLVTGEIAHTYASTCRQDNKRCDVSGKYFEQKLK